MTVLAGIRFLPVMISRIMLSLRKAALGQQNGFSIPVNSGTGGRMEFFHSPGGSSVRGDGIPLHTYHRSRMEGLSVKAS